MACNYFDKEADKIKKYEDFFNVKIRCTQEEVKITGPNFRIDEAVKKLNKVLLKFYQSIIKNEITDPLWIEAMQRIGIPNLEKSHCIEIIK